MPSVCVQWLTTTGSKQEASLVFGSLRQGWLNLLGVSDHREIPTWALAAATHGHFLVPAHPQQLQTEETLAWALHALSG